MTKLEQLREAVRLQGMAANGIRHNNILFKEAACNLDLPAILAVVEAAEEVDAHNDGVGHTTYVSGLHEALAALGKE